MDQDWQTRVAEKQECCRKAIPEEWKLPESLWKNLPHPLETSRTNVMSIPRESGILTEREISITEDYDVPMLLRALSSGALTSLEVTLAFSKRAAIAQQLTKCLTETFFEEAQERARYLDKKREEGHTLGPLHGLPVSIKDCFCVAGKETTLGLVYYLGNTVKSNCAMVDSLLELGAVLYVKTNIPQTMMTADSHNNVFGRTLNPWNTSLTAGGSSGGEGALVAFRGSPLGIGTDIAGSVRIPSLCCGTYGFKPTANRLPYRGQLEPADSGYKPIVPLSGPLANDINALEILAKAAIGLRPALLDSDILDVPWRVLESKPEKRLRFGILAEDPMFPLHPTVKEALARAVEAVRRQGHEVVELTPEEGQIAAISEVASDLFALGGSKEDIFTAGGEPPIPSRKIIFDELMSLDWTFLKDLRSSGKTERFSLLAEVMTRREKLTENWRKVWVNHDLDAVLAPPAQTTAVEHDMYGWPPYTIFLNVLDYPACILPCGKAKDSGAAFTKKPGQGAPDYNPEMLEGAPCSVQVFTSRLRDEECLMISKIVDGYLRKENI